MILDNLTDQPVAAWALRKLRAAYAGAAAQIFWSNDSSLHDVGFTAAGDFDLQAFDAIGPRAQLFVAKLYDQKGAFDLDFAAGKRPTITVLNRPMLDWGRTVNNQIVGTSSLTGNFTAPKHIMVLDYAVQNTCSIVDFGVNLFRLYVNGPFHQYNGADVAYGISDASNTVSELRGTKQLSCIFQTGNDSVRVNGVDLSGAANAGDTARNAVPIALGNSVASSFGFTGRIGEDILFEVAISAGDLNTLEADQIAYYQSGNRLSALGDSLQYGSKLDDTPPLLAQTFNPVAQARDLLGDGWDIYNRSWPGKTVNEMDSEANAILGPFYRATAKQNILCLNGGFNDAFQGRTVSMIIANWQSLLAKCRAMGYQTVVSPLPISTFAGSPGTPPDYMTPGGTRETANNWLAANSSLYDVFCDTRNDPIMGDHGDSNNLTYFSDGLHMTQAGYAVWASYLQPAILAAAKGTFSWTAPIVFTGFNGKVQATIAANPDGSAIRANKKLVARWDLAANSYQLLLVDLTDPGVPGCYDLVIAFKTDQFLYIGPPDNRVLTPGNKLTEGSFVATPV
jgi:lysophospholipase L1-like esterase